MSTKYSQKLLDSAKNSTTDAIKTASKRAIHKIADKVTIISKSPQNASNELHSKTDANEIPKERYISPEKRQQIIDELRLV